MAKTLEELMNMTDDEITSAVDPVDAPEVQPEVEQPDPNAEQDDEDDKGDEGTGSTDEDDDDDEDDKPAGSDGDKPADDPADKPAADDKSKPADKKKPEDTSAKPNDSAKDPSKVKADETKAKDNQVKGPDYKAAYEKIMTPFKANGKEIKLENVDEAVKLMQMGANYTKKMQALQPNLKIVKMLENNQLLDENKLSLLIDMTKGDKAAFAKFVKDSGIDPMDIDTESATTYKQGNHAVSDTAIDLGNILDEVVNTSQGGQELIAQMHGEWDKASQQAIFDEPQLIRVLAQQKADGIYDQIASVVNRQKVLGNPQIASMSFIKAYEFVGQQMKAQGLLKPPASAAQAVDPAKLEKAAKELARGTAPKRKAATNDAKAKAAAPSANSTRAAKQEFNPLAGTDEEFLEQMKNRV